MLLQVFAATYRIFSCSMWDLASCPGVESGLPAWELRVLATGPPGKPLVTIT